jgi:hypothetical protein
MKVTNLDAVLERRPFRPFEVRVEGEALQVLHPEQFMFAEGRSSVIIVDPEDHIHILDVDQISKIRVLPRRRSKAGTASAAS